MNGIRFPSVGLLALFFFFIFSGLYAADPAKDWDIEELMDQEITVDLREPVFEEGALRTDLGGVIFTDCMRIQARMITYCKTETSATVQAEGDLMVEYGPYVFVGSSLYYDFETKTGTIRYGRTAAAPWYIGGEQIDLLSDGNYFIHHPYVTTSENIDPEWMISAEGATVTDYNYLQTKNVRFHLSRLPVFWIPGFRINMASCLDSPLRYTFRVGGRKGPRVGVAYEIYSSERWKSFARVDYRLERGLGGGLELQYASLDKREYFQSINYFANDISLSEPDKRKRYRLQGLYDNSINYGKTTVHITYDKLSDRDMATDYHDRGLELDTAKRTGLQIRHQERNWITNFLTWVRINNFQTVNQELPTIAGSIRPYNFGSSGLILQSGYRISYLDFAYDKFDKSDPDVSDYNSTRLEFNSKLYRPFCLGPINFTPSSEGFAIFYGNNSDSSEQWLTLGRFQAEFNTELQRRYGNYKHVLIPYLNYKYITWPSIVPDDHHIFSINDGWFEVSRLTAGFRNLLLVQEARGCIRQKLYADFYTYAFPDTNEIPQILPKAYADLHYYATPRMKHTLGTAWDFSHGVLDHVNLRTDITISEDAALSFEYRHRSAFDWRKVDDTNFIMDSYRPVDELLDTVISDRRDTLLFHIYYRFQPEWVFEFESRHGWNRKTEPNYDEYQFNLIGNLRSAWNVRFSYRHKENEDRFTFNIGIGIHKPGSGALCPTPCLNF